MSTFFKKPFLHTYFYLPCLSIIQGIAHPLALQSTSNINFQSMKAKFFKIAESLLSKFNSLSFKLRLCILINLAVLIGALLCIVFSPLIAVLGLIIISQVFALLHVNIKLDSFVTQRNKEVDPVAIAETFQKCFEAASMSETTAEERPSITSFSERSFVGDTVKSHNQSDLWTQQEVITFSTPPSKKTM